MIRALSPRHDRWSAGTTPPFPIPPMSSPFLAAVAARVILADGAMGTQLYEHGL
ncbi:MAG: hypothetical protein GW783_08605, partial [Deltaproteobacteria bacterium]|nr:hypothetical protein [Deltaproteobacteria bacterium]